MTHRLAIDGGDPVRSRPFAAWPAPGDDEVAAAERVLRSGNINYWTGTEGRSFESEYAERLGRSHGLALANGTLALELALRAFEIGSGDEVVVPARTFIATAGAVVAVGARPVVCDIDPDSGNMTAEAVSAVLTERTRALIPVHVGGWPVDMEPLNRLAAERDLIVIEDCAQAHGATYQGGPAGYLGSHAGAFSFCQDKILPSGEGGLLVLDADEPFERAWSYRDHGKDSQKALEASQSPERGYKWLVDSFGSNFRLDELSAAVARVGLDKLDGWHEGRARNGLSLAEQLRTVPGLRVPLPGAGIEHAFYRLYAYVEPDLLAEGWTRDRIIEAVNAEGVPCQYGTCAEIYREQAFASRGFAPASRLPVAARIHETSLAFFVHPTLNESDMADTAAAVTKVMKGAAR